MVSPLRPNGDLASPNTGLLRVEAGGIVKSQCRPFLILIHSFMIKSLPLGKCALWIALRGLPTQLSEISTELSQKLLRFLDNLDIAMEAS